MANADVFTDALDSVRENLRKKRKPGSTEVVEVEEGEMTVLQMLRSEIRELKDGMNNVLSAVDVIRDEIREKFSGFEARFTAVEEKLESQCDEVRRLKVGMGVYEERMRDMEEKLIDHEARSRRNNLILHGVAESESANEDCVKVAAAIFLDKCRIKENLSIQRAHRLGGKRARTTGQAPPKPRPIIVNFLDFNHKERAREGKRHLPPGIHVAEDLPLPIRQARKQLMPEMHAAKQAGKRAWITGPSYHRWA